MKYLFCVSRQRSNDSLHGFYHSLLIEVPNLHPELLEIPGMVTSSTKVMYIVVAVPNLLSWEGWSRVICYWTIPFTRGRVVRTEEMVEPLSPPAFLVTPPPFSVVFPDAVWVKVGSLRSNRDPCPLGRGWFSVGVQTGSKLVLNVSTSRISPSGPPCRERYMTTGWCGVSKNQSRWLVGILCVFDRFYFIKFHIMTLSSRDFYRRFPNVARL